MKPVEEQQIIRLVFPRNVKQVTVQVEQNPTYIFFFNNFVLAETLPKLTEWQPN